MLVFFFFHDTATTEIYTLSLHDALPIYHGFRAEPGQLFFLTSAFFFAFMFNINSRVANRIPTIALSSIQLMRSEEHTSELQSRPHLVCRLLLEKKKKKQIHFLYIYITL